MSNAIIQQPQNKNLLSPNKFIFSISKSPYLVYYVQSVRLPGVSSSPATMETPHSLLHFTNDKLQFETLNITFLVDEDMKVWEETFNWMKGISFPNEHKQYRDQKAKEHLYSDAILELNTNNNTPNFKIKYKNCFPISLGAIDLSFKDNPENSITSDVTFSIDTFEFERNS